MKPKLRRIWRHREWNGRFAPIFWSCSGGFTVGFGRSPKTAYSDWHAKALERVAQSKELFGLDVPLG